MAQVHINEFLCFLSVQFDNFGKENLITTLVESYVFNEALEAKNYLITKCNELNIGDSITEFTKTRIPGRSGALIRVVTDAVDIWTVIDRLLKGEIGVQFVAADPNRIPSANVEKFNVQHLIVAITKLQEQVQNLTLSHDKSILELKQQIETNNNNNNNNKTNKRKLSGSSPAFTPKRLQTGANSSSRSPLPGGQTEASSTASVTTTPESFPVSTSVSTPQWTSDSLRKKTPASLPLAKTDSLLSTTPILLPVATPNSLPSAASDSLTSTTSDPSTTVSPGSLPTPTSDSLPVAPTAQDPSTTTPDILFPTSPLVVSLLLPRQEATSAPGTSAAGVEPVAAVEPAADAADASASAAGSNLAQPDSLSKTSFAGKAKALQIDRNDWIVIQRKKKKIIPVTGSGESSVLEGVAKTKKDYWEIGISRLKLGTSSDLVKAHLQGKNIEVKEVFVFPSKIKGTVSAKVRVALEHRARALDATVWPEHVRVSSWTNKSKEQRQDDARKRHQTKF